MDSLTVPETPVCVQSCENLLPTAYIANGACKRSCADLEGIIYISNANPDNPACVNECPEILPYIDNLTIPGSPICVKSC